MKCKNKVINLKVKGKGQDCEWKTLYAGEEVPENWKGPFEKQGGIYEVEEVKPEPVVEEKEDLPTTSEKPKVEGKKEEVIVEEKVEKKIDYMSKDELEEYAKEKYGVDLDKRKSLYSLIKQIKELSNG